MNNRVLGVVGIVVGILLTGFVYMTLTGAFARFQETWVEEELRSRLEVLAQTTAQSLLPWLVEEDDLEATRILQDLVSRTEGIYHAVVVDREDRVFATYPERDLSFGDTFLPSQPALRQTSLRTVFGRLPEKPGIFMIGVPVVMTVQGQPRRVGALYVMVTDRFVSQSVLEAYEALRKRVTTITLGAFGVLLLMLLGMLFAAGGAETPVARVAPPQGLVIHPSDSPEHLQQVRQILSPPEGTEVALGSVRLTLQTPDRGVVVGRSSPAFWGSVGIGKRDAAHVAALGVIGKLLALRLPEEEGVALSEWMGLLELSLDFMDLSQPELVLAVGCADGFIEIAGAGEMFAFVVKEGDPDMAEVHRLDESSPRLSLALARAVDREPLRLDASTMGVVLAAFPEGMFRSRVEAMVREGRAPVEEVENLVNEDAFGWVLALERAG